MNKLPTEINWIELMKSFKDVNITPSKLSYLTGINANTISNYHAGVANPSYKNGALIINAAVDVGVRVE